LREKDRTTWLGTNLGVKGESKAQKEKKRKAEEEGGLVGKYLAGPGTGSGAKAGAGVGAKSAAPVAMEMEFGGEKKKRKPGGFGDFSGW
jgi:peptidyl-prolyl cis-trans isomerase-like protein 2